MTRSLRIEFSGAPHHVTGRGNAQGDLYASNESSLEFQSLLNNTRNRVTGYVTLIVSELMGSETNINTNDFQLSPIPLILPTPLIVPALKPDLTPALFLCSYFARLFDQYCDHHSFHNSS